MNKEFKFQLEMRKAKGVKVKRKKTPKWLFPKNAERHYDKVLYTLVQHIKHEIKKSIIPNIPIMIEQIKIKTYPNDRFDSVIDALSLILIITAKDLEEIIAWAIYQLIFIEREINTFNYYQFQRMNLSVFGTEFIGEEPWLNDQLELFANQNSSLITSLSEKELARVAGIIERGLQEGSRFNEISKEIEKSFGITRRHATLIARDQTTKLNASLTRLRQEEVGVTEYIWSTAQDERVRPTHKANEGKKFKWSKPSKITGHPGHDVNCRCVAIPVLEGII
jgi:SPP1 gp7 family putative phage head morphogenesis protein